jgi:hypothetical protein
LSSVSRLRSLTPEVELTGLGSAGSSSVIHSQSGAAAWIGQDAPDVVGCPLLLVHGDHSPLLRLCHSKSSAGRARCT